MVVTIEGRLKDDYCYGTPLRNDAWIDLPFQYPIDGFLDDADFATGEVQSPDLWIGVQAIGPDPEFLDDTVTFRIDYGNSGNLAVSNAEIIGFVNDELYDLTSDLPWVSPVATSTGWNIQWMFESIPDVIEPGESGVIIVTGLLASNTYAPGTPLCLYANIGTDIPENLCGNGFNNYS